MTPGKYVVRQTRRQTRRQNLIVESRPLASDEAARNWRDFVQGEHPKDRVFVIEVKEL